MKALKYFRVHSILVPVRANVLAPVFFPNIKLTSDEEYEELLQKQREINKGANSRKKPKKGKAETPENNEETNQDAAEEITEEEQ